MAKRLPRWIDIGLAISFSLFLFGCAGSDWDKGLTMVRVPMALPLIDEALGEVSVSGSGRVMPTAGDGMGGLLIKKFGGVTRNDVAELIKGELLRRKVFSDNDWLKKPLAEINRKMINTRHRRIGKKSGTYAANAAMRAFRTAYNRAMKQHEDLPTNPTINVDWFEESPREAAISDSQLADWYQDITSLPNPIRHDYYLFVLFSGLRRQSAAEIRWEHIDLDNGTLLIPNPKGGAKRAFVLPLSDFLLEVLNRRKVENEKLVSDSPWVFPSPKSKAGHISEPKLKPNQIASMKVPFSIHGLRHTWMTAANAVGLSPYDIKMLANHGLPKGDVTAGYIGAHIEALRGSQQRVTDYLKKHVLQ